MSTQINIKGSTEPTGPAGGDLSGTYPNPTVDGLQGRPVSSATPVNGQVLQYDGTTWVPGSIPSGGSGGGGVVYYLNFNTAADAPLTNIPQTPNTSKELGITAEVTASSYTSAILPTANYVFLASFVTDLNTPFSTSIPAGLWDFNIYAESTTSNAANQTSFKIEVFKYDGSNAPVSLAASNEIFIYDPTEITQYVASVILPQTTILNTDRIVVYLYGKAHQNNNTLTFHFGDGYPSHVHSTIPSVTGTGVVKVVNGVFQSPASTIVNSDVSATAAIDQSKLALVNAAADGSTKGIAAFTSSDFDSASGVISLDYANGQKASGSQDGFLSSSNWTTFNNKVSTGAITGSGLTMATSRLLGRTTASSGAVEEITAGTGLTLSGGTLSVSGAVIAVGTSAVTSGTDGRVFFQAGGVVQQDANFTFDNTLKRLTLKAVGTASTDIPFAVQNSAGSANLMQVAGDNTMTFLSSGGKIIFSQDTVGQGSVISLRRDFSNQEIIRLDGTNGGGITINPLNDGSVKSVAIGSVANGLSMWTTGLNSHNFQIKNSFHNLFHVVGDPSSATATFRIGTIASNTNFFNVHGRNAGGTGLTTNPVFTINSSGTVGIGTEASTPGARLDVRAQGALSTDIAFRVRNSADTQNLMSIAGNGDVAIGLNASGVNAGAGYEFISIGSSAKSSQYGISIGPSAGKNQDNGDRRNIYIGSDVASSGTNRTAAYNIGIGNRSLLAINSGSNNIAIGLGSSPGEGAGEAISTGSENVIVGVGAGASITTGGTNTAIGRYAGAQNVTGASNTQVGYAVDQASGTNKSHITAIGMRLRSSHNGVIMLGSSGNTGVFAPSIADDAAQFHFRSDLQSLYFNKNTNVVLRSNSSLTSGTHFDASATNTLTIHNGTAPATNISNAQQLYAESGALRCRDGNGDITNIAGTIQSVVSAATVTPVSTNKFVKITAQAVALTMAAPTGTIAEGQDLMIRIKDNGSAQTIAWNAIYRAIGVTLPTTTVAGKTTYVGLIYNSDDSRWDAIGVTTEA